MWTNLSTLCGKAACRPCVDHVLLRRMMSSAFTVDAGQLPKVLQEELLRRCKKNPKYSLRAFAKALGVDASLLSKILRGSRVPGRKVAETIVQRLDLKPEERIKLFGSTQPTGASAANGYQQLSLDHFHVIADWYHYAIFELFAVTGFKPEPRWIAARLGISVSEARLALERLERLEIIEKDKTGRYRRVTDHITTVGNAFTASAFRKLQKQILKQALSALEEIPMNHRDQSSLTVAMRADRIDDVKLKIKTFRRELCEFLERDDERDSVYQLSVSFFPTGVKL